MVDILTNILGQAITEVGKSLAVSIKRQFNYLCCFKSNIQSLSDEAQKLDDARATLQMQVDEANNNAQVIVPEVINWLAKTRNIQDEKNQIESGVPNVQKGYLSIISRVPLSKKAKKLAEAMKELCKGCKLIDRISLPPPPPAAQVPILEESTYEFQSRKDIEEELMKALRDENVKMVGICGMGGIGKTTMAKKLRHRVKEENLFDETVMVVVSQQLDMLKIQLGIAEQLGCEDLKILETLEARANKLFARLGGTRRTLIVLDDIWEKIKLEELGIPCGANSKGCTVLLTSRTEDLLKQMDVKVFGMKTLSQSEAWSLFREKAGTCVEDELLMTIAKEVADECNGLPIAIVTIGSALKNQERPIWKDALDRLKSSSPSNMPQYMKEEVYIRLRLSYDYLKDPEAESLFLLCSFFDEDFNIKLEDLAFYSMGLRMFEGVDSLEQARNRVFTVAKKLKSRFLLLEGYGENQVKMHDVIRDLALFIASEKGLTDDAKLRLKGKCDRKCEWLSVVPTKSFHDQVMEFSFPNLRLLMVHGPWFDETFEICITQVLERMQGLKVLSLRYISYMKSLPQSIELLKNLRSLQLLYCSMPTLSPVGALSNLEILQCYDCDMIQELPVEIGKLKCLKLLHLYNCVSLERIAPGVISTLVELEELKMYNSFNKWESTNVTGENRKNPTLRELESLRKLVCLEIELEDLNLLEEEIPHFPEVVNYKIFGGERKVVFNFGSDKGRDRERKIDLQGFSGKNGFGNWIQKLVNTTEGLYLDAEGAGLRNLHLSEAQNCIKDLEIKHCRMIEELVDTSTISNDFGGLRVFHMLEYLRLYDLQDLKQVCDGSPLKSISFGNLRELYLKDLPSLTHFVNNTNEEGGKTSSSSMTFPKLKKLRLCSLPILTSFWEGIEMIEFPSLEELDIKECPKLNDALHKIVFGQISNLPKLKTLRLEGLSNLITLGKGIESIEFSILEELKIISCPKLKSIVSLTESNKQRGDGCNNDEFAHSLCNEKVKFGNLKTLCIRNCHGISSLFSSSMTQNLTSLKILEIKHCDNMKYVIAHEMARHENSILFPSLEILRIENMQSLEMFCECKGTHNWSLLEEISIVGGCPHLKFPDLSDPSHPLKSLQLVDPLTPSKVVRLLYTNSGLAVLALASNGVHKLWKRKRNYHNASRMPSTSSDWQFWQPLTGGALMMSNDMNDVEPTEDSVACFAVSMNEFFLFSASGGRVSLFNMMAFKVMTTFMPPPPAVSCLALYPKDNNVIAIGMEDSTIQIYNVRLDEVTVQLKGHQKRISGLAFSSSSEILVSSGADAGLCLWSTDGWEKEKSCLIQSPPGVPAPLAGETMVQFHYNQSHLLVVHKSQIAIYDANLDCLRCWYPRDPLSSPVSSATFSCDGRLIFSGFYDGVVGIYDYESLTLQRRIAPSAYISPLISSNDDVCPVVIAAHPKHSSQFALGMSDGAVYVIKPSVVEFPSGSATNSQP